MLQETYFGAVQQEACDSKMAPGVLAAGRTHKEIPTELQRLSGSVEEVGKRLVMVADRLAPLRGPLPPQKDQVAGKRAYSSDYGRAIGEIADQVQLMNTRLDEIYNTLQI